MNEEAHFKSAVIVAACIGFGAVLLMSACVTRKECMRYAEAKQSLGTMEGLVKGAEPWEQAYLNCEKHLTACQNKESPE